MALSSKEALYNSLDFQLSSENIPYIFKEGLFLRELDPIIENKPRTLTITCTQLNCR